MAHLSRPLAVLLAVAVPAVAWTADADRCETLAPQTAPWQVTAAGDAARTSLPVPERLERRVAFWERVWSERGDHEFYLVDGRRPWAVHAEVDCRDVYERLPRAAAKESCRARVAARLRTLKAELRRDAVRRPRRLARRLGHRALVPTAHRNLRLIEGRRDALERAFERGGHLLPELETVFEEAGAPAALARLAVVESLFRASSESHAGAVGAYQFVAATARDFMTVGPAVDERLDPLRSGWAAATYLSRLHRRFDDWSLAVTAYNAGPTRLRRRLAAARTRDLGRLADRASADGFGFDAQNYYAQVVAVARLTAERPLPSSSPMAVEHRRLAEPMSLAVLARCLETSPEALVEANPALTAAARSGERPIPAGFLAAVPVPRRVAWAGPASPLVVDG